MNILIVLTILLSFSFQGCSQSRDKINNLFIENHGKDEFNKFNNKSFIVRSSTKKEVVIFIYDYSYAHWNSLDSGHCGFVRVIISNKNNELLSCSFIPQKDDCTMSYDQEEYYKLAIDFLQFKINSLSVDKTNNVFVKTTFYEGLPDLIQVNNQDHIKDFNQLILIKDNWYRRK